MQKSALIIVCKLIICDTQNLNLISFKKHVIFNISNNNYLNFSKYHCTKTNFDSKKEKEKLNLSKNPLRNIMLSSFFLVIIDIL